jgi:hypothetical protein
MYEKCTQSFGKKVEEITRRLCHRLLGRINIETELEGKMTEAAVWIYRLHENNNGFKFQLRQSFLTEM